MTWLEEIINAFSNIQQEAVPYKTLYNHIERHSGRDLPAAWKEIIRRTIQQNSSASKAYSGKNDIFSSVNGIGKGIWQLKNRIKETRKASDLNEPVDYSNPSRVWTQTYRILRDTNLSRSLKVLYDNTCQICGHRICTDIFKYSEAHHIKPLGNPHNGPDTLDNLLVLCPNHHVEFDYGLIAIDHNLNIIHKDASNTFVGEKIYIIDNHNINTYFLEYHIQIIYNKMD